MATNTAKGEISQRRNVYYKIEIEWTIKDIFSYAKVDEWVKSPAFSVSGSEWYLKIYPNGRTEDTSVGWIHLYLTRGSDDSIPYKEVNFNLGFKNVDGTVEEEVDDVSDFFFEKDYESGIHCFMKRSELLERRSELAPSGALTVICTMRVKDDTGTEVHRTQRLITLSDDLKNMATSAKGSNATLKVQDREFPVHKSVLASRSSVFEAIFEVDMKEKSTGTVDIVDCHPQAFDDFLAYVYSGQFKISSGDAFELYKIAHKYCTEELKSGCVFYILSNLSVDNVIDVAILGDQFDERELQCKSQVFFNRNFAAVVATDKWSSLLRKNPSLGNRLINSMTKRMELIEKKCDYCSESFF